MGVRPGMVGMEPTWQNQLHFARQLDDKELRRHARVSIDNNHRCMDCFCCACVEVMRERTSRRSHR